MRVLILYKQAHWVSKLQKMIMYGIQIWLVVSTPLKNMKVSWDDYSRYMESHIPFMFQTTNQLSSTYP